MYKTRIKIIDYAGASISSSEIRELVRKNKPISGLVCPDVEEYILSKGLYKT
jgi:nicotinic acid mononucleotide adenylyltransferase